MRFWTLSLQGPTNHLAKVALRLDSQTVDSLSIVIVDPLALRSPLNAAPGDGRKVSGTCN